MRTAPVIGQWFTRQPAPVLRGEGLLLRAPRMRDFEDWRRTRLESRAFLKPYEPRWSESDLTRTVFAGRVRRAEREMAQGSDYSFLIFDTSGRGERLVGGLTLSNIRRRAAQHVNLGYWMAVGDAGKGMMTRAVALTLPFIFDSLQLRRVHAACLPDNAASRRVLEKNGFEQEGFAPNYLQIDGQWRDHLLFALTRERYDAGRVRGR